MNVVKLTIENENGKYKFFTTEETVMDIMKHNEVFNSKIIDAKTGEIIIHREKVIDALKIEPPKNNQ
jgi:hypothetical protein